MHTILDWPVMVMTCPHLKMILDPERIGDKIMVAVCSQCGPMEIKWPEYRRE